jgi:peptide-methionine (S)-S-oxide reductase
MNPNQQANQEMATLAGGCFWCLEAVYQQLRGVKKVVSGYTGGSMPDPSYKMVCTGATGHAEAVQITYDPDELSYREILEVFFTIHDPTTLNRQGADVGTQYRSAIYYHDPGQKELAQKVMDEITAEKIYDHPLVTELKPLEVFYPAENYHQNYYQENLNQPYCQFVISPKVAKFRKKYAEKLSQPV